MKLDGQLVETKPVKIGPGEVSPQFSSRHKRMTVFTVHLTGRISRRGQPGFGRSRCRIR